MRLTQDDADPGSGDSSPASNGTASPAKEHLNTESLLQRLQRLEGRVQEIVEALALVTARLSALEEGKVEAPAAPSRSSSRARFRPAFAGNLLNLLTRVAEAAWFSGAFLVRSLTDSESSRGRRAPPSGSPTLFSGSARGPIRGSGKPLFRRLPRITAVVIAYPLIAETTTRLPVFAPSEGPRRWRS